jgi:hypothetical protein
MFHTDIFLLINAANHKLLASRLMWPIELCRLQLFVWRRNSPELFAARQVEVYIPPHISVHINKCVLINASDCCKLHIQCEQELLAVRIFKETSTHTPVPEVVCCCLTLLVLCIVVCLCNEELPIS